MASSRSSWDIFRAVIFALLVRELKTRFGKWRLGYVWVFLEPIIAVLLMVIVMSSLRGGQAPWYGIPVPLLIGAGYLVFSFFSHLTSGLWGRLAQIARCFGYRQVKPVDTLISRALLEVVVFLCVLVILNIGYDWFFEHDLLPDRPLRLFATIGLLVVFCFGLGIVFAVMGSLTPELAKIIMPFVTRPLLFISCVMYPLESVPAQYRAYFLWNPLLHAIEQFRYSWFANYPGEQTSLGFLAISGLLVNSFGLVLYSAKRLKILAY